MDELDRKRRDKFPPPLVVSESTPVAFAPHSKTVKQAEQIPAEVVARRRTICESCDLWRDGMCQAVRRGGCKEKARKPWTCTQCPEGRWELPVVKPLASADIVRHLCYHIYPISGNGAWQRNVSRLVERLRIINGKKIVAIVTDPPEGRKPDPTGPHPPGGSRAFAPCDSPETVKAAFGHWADQIDFIEMENDPNLREVKPLIPMLERLPSGPNDVTLYAQAKATTYHPGHIANHWSDVLYIIYFDYWLLVEEQLRQFACTGAFKKLGAGWSPTQHKSDWHYSGSYCWFRNADLFSRNWRQVDQGWSGIEPYPSQHFFAREAGCLFHQDAVSSMKLYSPKYWRRVVDPAFAKWRTDNKKYETPF